MGPSYGGTAGLACGTGRAEPPVWGSLPAEPVTGAAWLPSGEDTVCDVPGELPSLWLHLRAVV